MKSIRSICLKDIEHTKKFYSKLINEYNRDEISTDKFRSLIYGVSKYAELLRLNETEKKIFEIEEKINKISEALNASKN